MTLLMRFISPRLETRTKESIRYASIRVDKTQGCVMKVKGIIWKALKCEGVIRREGKSFWWRSWQHWPTIKFLLKGSFGIKLGCFSYGLSYSISARTRKMVNYAWIRVKSEETLMEARSDTDVQLVRQIWV